MKLIKNITFLMLAASAVFFAACEPNGNQTETTTFKVTNKADNKEIKDGDVITVTNFDSSFGTPEAIFDMDFTFNHEDAKDYTITETRNFDLAKYSSAMCINQCVPGTTDKTQEWPMGDYAKGDEKAVQYHAYVSKDTVNEAAVISADLTISNGQTQLSFTVNFAYTPAEN
ncbi:MAG: hypothetical protein ACI3Z7_07690 [Candidatus Aphodosoma sp.]